MEHRIKVLLQSCTLDPMAVAVFFAMAVILLASKGKSDGKKTRPD